MNTCRSSSLPPDEHAGIIPRVINDLFTEMASRASTVDFTVTATFCELYKEELIDLLDSTSDKIPAIREDTAGNVMVTGLKEVEVGAANELFFSFALPYSIPENTL